MKAVPVAAVLCAAVICVSTSPLFEATPTKRCPDFKGGDIKVKSVNIANCTASPCVIKRGDNNTAIIQIESTVKLTNVTNKIYGVVRNTKILFKTLDGCTYGLDCPVPANTARTETVTLPTVGYPPINITAEWDFLDEFGKEQGCFRVELNLV